MLSKRINNMNKSIFYEYSSLIEKREQEGISFYKLNMGQPDFDTDSLYFESLSKFKQKINSYGDPAGLLYLKDEVSNYYNNLYIQKMIKSDDIIVTQGASDALIKILYSICDEKDEIIIIEPFFSDYKTYCYMTHVKIKSITDKDITSKKLEKIITKKTKAILFANPNNPDGQIINKEKAKILLDSVQKHNLFIIADEVYSGLIYSKKYISFIEYLDNNVIVVDSASKKLNLCGSRIGYIITKNEDLKNKIIMLNDSRISISNVEQYAVGNMLKESNRIIKKARNKYQKRLKIISKKLEGTELNYKMPSGGITILIEFPFDTRKYIEWLINKYEKDKHSILVAPGDSFYNSAEGKNKIRICITLNDKELEKALDLLIDSYKRYKEEII